jgi:serine/threonine protein kinase
MTPERYEQAFQVFRVARRMASRQRASFLAVACEGDDELRSEIDSLLDFHEPSWEASGGERRLVDGTVLAGRYLVEAFLGEGGTGSVYRASDLSTGETVAVKVPCVEADRRPAALDALEREALTVAHLRHPHILRVLEVAVDPILGAFLSLEYAEGPTFAEAIDRAGRLAVGETAAIMGPVCSAVHAAHEAGVIHRDLKPQNVLLAERGGRTHPLVLDFGTARFQNPTTLERGLRSVSGGLVGTPHFMAPEQCEGRKADARTDVYSLGCMLYTALAGRPPFPGATVAVVLMMHLSATPEALGDVAPGVPRAFDEIVARALSKDPDRRYQSARHLGEAVARVL